MRITVKAAGGLRRRSLLGKAAGCFALGGIAAVARMGHAQLPLFLGVTTSAENSGLLAHLVEAFDADHGLQIRAVTAGSGAVLNLAARGDVDVVLVHAPEDEEAFIAAGHGIDRRPVMRNHFIIVGPKNDPAGVGRATDAEGAFAAIVESGALFLSRGDGSGTHNAELRIWKRLGVDPTNIGAVEAGSGWYRESGSGQGATLNIAANTGAYTLTDEATWTTFGNRGDLQTLFAREEPAMLNLYSIIRVNPERHPGLNVEGALTFADWITSKAGQAVIEAFRSGGRSLFQPEKRLAG